MVRWIAQYWRHISFISSVLKFQVPARRSRTRPPWLPPPQQWPLVGICRSINQIGWLFMLDGRVHAITAAAVSLVVVGVAGTVADVAGAGDHDHGHLLLAMADQFVFAPGFAAVSR